MTLAGDLGCGVGDSRTGFGDLCSSTELVVSAFTWNGSEVLLWLSVAYLQKSNNPYDEPAKQLQSSKGI